jgi:hypothetical protein
MKSAMSIVYMADVIGSHETLTPERYARFKAVVEDANKEFSDKLASPLTITLGDEFQAVVRGVDRTGSIAAATGIIFWMEEQLLIRRTGLTLRHVIHEGVIESPINPEVAHGMVGEGLTKAREQLAALKKGRGISKRFSFHLHGLPLFSDQLERCFLLYEAIIGSWKPKDAELIATFLEHKDYKKVAEVLEKDTSLMWRREGWLWVREYQELKNLVREMVLSLDLKPDADRPESIPDLLHSH